VTSLFACSSPANLKILCSEASRIQPESPFPFSPSQLRNFQTLLKHHQPKGVDFISALLFSSGYGFEEIGFMFCPQGSLDLRAASSVPQRRNQSESNPDRRQGGGQPD
jgi:hypothetical protein